MVVNGGASSFLLKKFDLQIPEGVYDQLVDTLGGDESPSGTSGRFYHVEQSLNLGVLLLPEQH